MELTEQEREDLSNLLLSFAESRGIKYPDEPTFIDDENYFDVVTTIEDFLKTYEVEK